MTVHSVALPSRRAASSAVEAADGPAGDRGGFWVRFDVALQRYAITNFEVALECLERADSPAREDTMLWGEYGFEALRSE